MKRFQFTVPNSLISTKDWDKGRLKTGKGKQENSYIQNDLNRLKETIEKFYAEYYRLNKKFPTDSNFKIFIHSNRTVDDFFINNKKVRVVEYISSIIERRKNGSELFKGNKYKNQTFNAYKSLILALENFQHYKKKAHFYLNDMTDIKMIEEFEYFITHEHKMRKNTIHKTLKTLKSFLQCAVNDDLIPFNPFIKFKKTLYTEDSDAIVFTEQELVELEKLSLESDYLDQIRDQYLLYVWSGVRKNDFNNFLAVVNSTSKSYVFRNSKTGEKCEIPGFPVIKSIFQKYNYNFPKPIHPNDVLREIKNICKRIPSMNILIEKKYTKLGKEVRELIPKYEMVMIHTARRTLATILADRGVPYHHIMKITGHKKLTTLQKYIKSETDIDSMLKAVNGFGN